MDKREVNLEDVPSSTVVVFHGDKYITRTASLEDCVKNRRPMLDKDAKLVYLPRDSKVLA